MITPAASPVEQRCHNGTHSGLILLRMEDLLEQNEEVSRRATRLVGLCSTGHICYRHAIASTNSQITRTLLTTCNRYKSSTWNLRHTSQQRHRMRQLSSPVASRNIAVLIYASILKTSSFQPKPEPKSPAPTPGSPHSPSSCRAKTPTTRSPGNSLAPTLTVEDFHKRFHYKASPLSRPISTNKT